VADVQGEKFTWYKAYVLRLKTYLSHRRLQTRQPSPLPWLVDAVVAAFTSSMAASRKATMDAAMAVLESSLTPRSGVLQSYDDGGKNGNDSYDDNGSYDR
jgi:hypothetical protein